MSAGVYGDDLDKLGGHNERMSGTTFLIIWLGLWIMWGGVFYRYYCDSSKALSVMVSWLLRGSVLELLIAVPAHVVARQRGDCSAPFVTGFGIVTGFAIVVLCFGPGVLALCKTRLNAYQRTE